MTDADQKSPRHPAPDAALDALEALCEAAHATKRDADLILERAASIREQRGKGRSWSQIVPAEEGPLVVELLTRSLARLSEAGGRWRREEALALHREGLSMERIADLFGVTRQRVSALLRESRAGGDHLEGSEGAAR